MTFIVDGLEYEMVVTKVSYLTYSYQCRRAEQHSREEARTA